MISPEVLRRYPFFAGLSHEHLKTLAMMADEMEVESGHVFFRDEDKLAAFYLVLDGDVAITMDITARDATPTLSQQLTGTVQTTGVVISHVGPGEPFGWTAITSAQKATAGAQATTDCKVVAFDRERLLAAFESDCEFGYRMIQGVLQVARQRLHDLRVESLSQTVR